MTERHIRAGAPGGRRPRTVADLRLHQLVWARCTHWWREVVVVRLARTRVTVAYRLVEGAAAREQTVSLDRVLIPEPPQDPPKDGGARDAS